MYILNITSAIKRCLSMKSEALSLKTIINQLDFLMKRVAIQRNITQKRSTIVCN